MPILADDRSAVGIVCLAGGTGKETSPPAEWAYTEGGPNPRLIHNLPGWLLRELLSVFHMDADVDGAVRR
jgi:hypothetical protein